MLYTAFLYNGPAAVRYPRGSGPGEVESKEMRAIPIGKGVVKQSGSRVALLAFGTMVNPALAAGVELDATVVNMRSVKPLDNELILEMAESHEIVVSIEENTIRGGAGAGIAEVLSAAGCTTPFLILGLPDHHVDQGETGPVLSDLGLDAAGIVASVRKRMALKTPASH
jgi:1-deoxy-D-xylulose-5-phosphate synthase